MLNQKHECKISTSAVQYSACLSFSRIRSTLAKTGPPAMPTYVHLRTLSLGIPARPATHNPLVHGSSPCGPTKQESRALRGFRRFWHLKKLVAWIAQNAFHPRFVQFCFWTGLHATSATTGFAAKIPASGFKVTNSTMWPGLKCAYVCVMASVACPSTF